jgi:cell wall-associated NlpC family hydrolase
VLLAVVAGALAGVLLSGGGDSMTVRPGRATVAGGAAGAVGATAPVKEATRAGGLHAGARAPASEAHPGGPSARLGQPASASAAGGGHPITGASGAAASGLKGTVAIPQVRDPEESRSFPLPASVHHRSASSPSVAGEIVPAQGAASDAQIRKYLGEEQRAEAQARAAQQRVLTPAAGGFSVGGNGTIPIPSGIPEAVQRVIAGGNAIADFPYIWGGGHASFIANGYDCSGSVSYALAAGGLLGSPLVSGDLASWGEPGPGRWITIYANAGHTFMDVDGMWFDTAGRSGPYASRWLVSQPSLAGYAVRHPPGL